MTRLKVLSPEIFAGCEELAAYISDQNPALTGRAFETADKPRPSGRGSAGTSLGCPVGQPVLASSRPPGRLSSPRGTEKPARRPARRQDWLPHKDKGKGKHKGGALLAVLWLSAGLAAIAFSISTTVRAETDRVSTTADGLRTWYLATGSVDRAIQWMLWGSEYRNPDGSPRFWDFNQPRMYLSYPSGDAVVEVIPEAAKLNINIANPDDLSKVVFAVSGDVARTRQIVEGILDWRNPAAPPTVFDQFYLTIHPTFRARHASFEEIEELLLVRGMTSELFYGNYVPDSDGRLYASGGLRDCLSVWGGYGPFDINAASPALMQAMGVPPEGVAAIVSRRRTQPFLQGEMAKLGFPAPRLAIIGGNAIWTLRATARLRRPDGTPSETVRTAAAVIKLLDRKRFNLPVHVLRWYDDAWSQSAIAPFPGMPGVSGVPQR